MLLQPFLLLAFANSIIAGLTLTATVTSSTSQTVQCVTKLTSTSAKTPIPTTSSTQTLTEVIIVLSASTPLTTITPAKTTTTTTITTMSTVTTTPSTITNTFSTTSTYTTTSSVTSTTVFSTTTTSTAYATVVATTIVPAPVGFVGVEVTSQENTSKQKRDVLGHLLGRRTAPKSNSQSYTYPTSVTCTKYVIIIYTEKIIAIKPTSTVTAVTPTFTSTVTATKTSTSTVCPSSVSVTSTFSTTQTVTTTITASSTSTITASTTITTSTTTTSYAACGPTNIVGPIIQTGEYAGDYYSEVSPFDDQADAFNAFGVNDAYDCCVLCLTADLCQFSQYLADGDQCVYFADDPNICSNPTYVAGSFDPIPPPYVSVQLSNGPCGVIVTYD